MRPERNIHKQLEQLSARDVAIAFQRLLQGPGARWPAHYSLAVLRWNFRWGLDWEYRSPKPHLDHNGIIRLRQLAYTLDGKATLPSSYPSLRVYFKSLLFQQGWQNTQNAKRSFARQVLLFREYKQPHPFARDFEAAVGATIEQFLLCTFAVVTRLMESPLQYFNRSWFDPIHPVVPAPAVDNALRVLSADLQQLRNLVQAENVPPDVHLDLMSPPFLKRHPLLYDRGSYSFWNSNLYYHSVASFIYDTLKGVGGEQFAQRFGAPFEAYVGRVLEHVENPVPEAAIQQRYGSGKTVDYLLENSAGIVLLDAKATEMSNAAILTHSAGLLKQRTKNALLKGFQQGQETAKRIRAVQPGAAPMFLIVVTFKSYYLGDGEDYCRTVIPDKVAKCEDACGGALPISPANILFLSIDELEMLVETAAACRCSIIELLICYTNHNENIPVFNRTTLQQYCEQRSPSTTMLPILADAFDRFCREFDAMA